MSSTYLLACGHTVVVPHGGSAKCEPCDALGQYVGTLTRRSEVAENPTPVPSEVAETTAGEREVEAWQRETAARLGRGDHWPTTPVQCVCGWRETDADSGTWVEHMSAALLDRVRREEGERIAQAIEAEGVNGMPHLFGRAAAIARAASVGRGEGL